MKYPESIDRLQYMPDGRFKVKDDPYPFHRVRRISSITWVLEHTAFPGQTNPIREGDTRKLEDAFQFGNWRQENLPIQHDRDHRERLVRVVAHLKKGSP